MGIHIVLPIKCIATTIGNACFAEGGHSTKTLFAKGQLLLFVYLDDDYDLCVVMWFCG